MELNSKQNRLLKLIIILTILLVLTSSALAGVIIYKYTNFGQTAPVTVPNNIITEEEQAAMAHSKLSLKRMPISGTLAASPIILEEAKGKNVTLKIYRNHANASTPFYANNLFPGDAVSKHFDVQVSYKGSVTVNFHADIRSGYEKLAEVLKCKISLSDGNVLYDGLMRDMPKAVEYTLPQSTGTTADLGYDMDVYLDTSVGNEYQNKTLIADFRWWVDETETSESTESSETTDSTESTRPSEDDADDTSEETSETEKVPSSGGSLIHPTGDTTKLLLWIGLAGVSLILILFLILIGRNKKEDTAHD